LTTAPDDAIVVCTKTLSFPEGGGLREMEETAWILRTDAKRHRVGFVPSKDLKPKDRFVVEED
jgi:hypothetical protein